MIAPPQKCKTDCGDMRTWWSERRSEQSLGGEKEVRRQGESADRASPQAGRVRRQGESADRANPQTGRVRRQGESADRASPQTGRAGGRGGVSGCGLSLEATTLRIRCNPQHDCAILSIAAALRIR